MIRNGNFPVPTALSIRIRSSMTFPVSVRTGTGRNPYKYTWRFPLLQSPALAIRFVMVLVVPSVPRHPTMVVTPPSRASESISSGVLVL